MWGVYAFLEIVKFRWLISYFFLNYSFFFLEMVKMNFNLGEKVFFIEGALRILGMALKIDKAKHHPFCQTL